MPTTVALHDDLVGLAQEYAGVAEKTALIREALNALIERESARRLASLGGTMPGLKPPHAGGRGDQRRQTPRALREEIVECNGKCEMKAMNQERSIHEEPRLALS